jgi:hydrogenase maturation protease
MSSRILIAGVGNVFFGDDGFGVAVAHRLERESFPEGVAIADFGVRGVHLAFELLATPELFVLVDAMTRGGRPGTLYVIDPAVDPDLLAAPPDAHALAPVTVLSMLRAMGGTLPRTRVIGCEPADLEEPMSLSEPVKQAIEPAIAMIRRLVESEVASHELEIEATR